MNLVARMLERAREAATIDARLETNVIQGRFARDSAEFATRAR